MNKFLATPSPLLYSVLQHGGYMLPREKAVLDPVLSTGRRPGKSWLDKLWSAITATLGR